MFKQISLNGFTMVVILVLVGCSSMGGHARNDFSESDHDIITAFYEEYAAPPTPGPGAYRTKPAQVKEKSDRQNIMTKKLARGAGYPLPLKLEQSLSPLESGYARAMVGWNVVIIDVHTKKVVDRIHALGY